MTARTTTPRPRGARAHTTCRHRFAGANLPKCPLCGFTEWALALPTGGDAR